VRKPFSSERFDEQREAIKAARRRDQALLKSASVAPASVSKAEQRRMYLEAHEEFSRRLPK